MQKMKPKADRGQPVCETLEEDYYPSQTRHSLKTNVKIVRHCDEEALELITASSKTYGFIRCNSLHLVSGY